MDDDEKECVSQTVPEGCVLMECSNGPVYQNGVRVTGTVVTREMKALLDRIKTGAKPRFMMRKSGTIEKVQICVRASATGVFSNWTNKNKGRHIVSVHLAVWLLSGKGDYRGKNNELDHLNARPWINLLENLRLVTGLENLFLKRDEDKGISKKPDGRWKFGSIAHKLCGRIIKNVLEEEPDAPVHRELIFRYTQRGSVCAFNSTKWDMSEVQLYRSALTHLALDFLWEHAREECFYSEETYQAVQAIYPRPDKEAFDTIMKKSQADKRLNIKKRKKATIANKSPRAGFNKLFGLK